MRRHRGHSHAAPVMVGITLALTAIALLPGCGSLLGAGSDDDSPANAGAPGSSSGTLPDGAPIDAASSTSDALAADGSSCKPSSFTCPNGVFCDTFDSASTPQVWNGAADGTLSLDTTTFASCPRSLLATAPANQSEANPERSVREHSVSPATGVSIEMDMFPGIAAWNKQSKVVLLSIVWSDENCIAASEKELELQLTSAGFAVQLCPSQCGSPNCGVAYPIVDLPTADAWTHVKLSVLSLSNVSTFDATIGTKGAEGGRTFQAGVASKVKVRVGVQTYVGSGAFSANYDNVVISPLGN